MVSLSELKTETWKTAWGYAKTYYRAIAGSHATRTYQWTLLGNDSAVGKDGERYPTFYVLKHHANYIPPGSVLVESVTGDDKLWSTALRRPDGRIALIVTNVSSTDKTFVVVSGSGGDAAVSQVVTTSEGNYWVEGGPQPVPGSRRDGFIVPPQSLTSLLID